MTMALLALLALWLIQFWLAYKVYGWTVAYYQGRFPLIAADCLDEDRGFALVFATLTILPVIGYVFAGITYCMSGFAKYGWRA